MKAFEIQYISRSIFTISLASISYKQMNNFHSPGQHLVLGINFTQQIKMCVFTRNILSKYPYKQSLCIFLESAGYCRGQFLDIRYTYSFLYTINQETYQSHVIHFSRLILLHFYELQSTATILEGTKVQTEAHQAGN